MKSILHTNFMVLLFICSCVKQTSPIVSNQTHLIVIGTLEYPPNYLNISLLETSNTLSYENKTPLNATIKLYEKTLDGTETLLTEAFVFKNNSYRSMEKIQTKIGNSYWVSITLPDRNGVYQSDKQKMLAPVPIRNVEKITDRYQVIFEDPKEEQNQYVAQFQFTENVMDMSSDELAVNDDTLFNGNRDAYLEVDIFWIPSSVSVQLSNVSPETYSFYKGFLQQKNENLSGENREGQISDPSILFRSPPVQLKSNVYNIKNSKELVIGNFGTMAVSRDTLDL